MAGRDEDGAVTAETAMALPMLALFTVSMAWLVGVGLTQVRAIDAARETARAAARAETPGTAQSLGRQVAPPGSQIRIEQREDTVVVSVSSPVRGPAWLFGAWAGFRVEAEAVAAREPGG